ncbi:hypothetical protein SAMN05192549_10977 [Duganella sacchari]|uniref:Uncharacterized protein n=1 Tax=Duganella sacchari TaxID=551987 RepID=A0A1M7R0V0_9BURK|nr:hypothetical protein [Duganella sacchari]SHN38213.1 hypothetical protein SAMN05192549_10977 [Duganella sacchari]
MMKALVLTLTLALAAANAAAYSMPDEQVKTPYGVLTASPSQGASLDAYTLTLGGKTLGKVEADAVNLYRVASSDSGPAYVIVDKNVPGLHCRHEFALVQISSETNASLSEGFGECMDFLDAKLTQDGVSIMLESPAIEGQKSHTEEWQWKHGVMSKAQAAAPSGLLRYDNSKYGYAVSYPASFVGQGVSDAGDGQIFTAPGNDASFTASGSYCEDGARALASFVDGYKQNEKKGSLTITYSRMTKSFAVVSGIRGSRIFYAKQTFNNTSCAKFSLEYEPAAKSVYAPLIGRIANSLKLN